MPLLDANEYSAEEGDVLVSGAPWLPMVARGLTRAILAPKLIQSAFHPLELARVLPASVDEVTIGELDRALTGVFGL